MLKRPRRIIAIVIFGVFVGLFNMLPAVSGGYIFLIIGSTCIFLSFGLFMLWNWVRILAFIFSYVFFTEYILLIILALQRAYKGLAGVTLIFNLPLLILCLIYIDNLRREEIKAYFKKK